MAQLPPHLHVTKVLNIFLRNVKEELQDHMLYDRLQLVKNT